MDFFTRRHEEEVKRNIESRDFIISAARKTITYLNKKKFENIIFETSIIFRKSEPELHITIFSNNNDNRSFQFYVFSGKEKNEKMYKELMSAVKKDDFDKIVSLKQTLKVK